MFGTIYLTILISTYYNLILIEDMTHIYMTHKRLLWCRLKQTPLVLLLQNDPLKDGAKFEDGVHGHVIGFHVWYVVFCLSQWLAL